MTKFSIDPNRVGPFRLKKVREGIYQIHANYGPAFEGPKNQIFRKAAELGVCASDLPIADSEMEENGHDVAEFGLGGGFLFTTTSKRRAA